MAQEKKNNVRFPMGFSPRGRVEYSWLAEPQPPYEGRGEPKYKLTISLDPNDEDVKKWAAGIKALTKFPGKPWKIDEESTMLHVTFKSLRQPKGYDSASNPLLKGVWPGRDSVVRVAYVPNEYPGFGGGINLYLQGVQVIEMVEGFGHSVDFPKEAGAYVSGEVSIHPAADGSAQDALPF